MASDPHGGSAAPLRLEVTPMGSQVRELAERRARAGRIHTHMVDGTQVVYTYGEDYDCPPERGCWTTVPRALAEALVG